MRRDAANCRTKNAPQILVGATDETKES